MNRIYHRYEKWECYPAGFYEEHPPKGLTDEECEKLYSKLLADIPEFKRIMYRIVSEWKYSCEHYLTNDKMNRIAWMGQASLTYKYGIPSKYRGGYHLLTTEQKKEADLSALEVINFWMFLHGEAPYTMDTIRSRTEANLY